MSDKENAIRGYVAMKLLKTGKGTKVRQYVAVVGDDQSYYDKWASKANRGGLVEVNDACFPFFYSVELRTQPQLESAEYNGSYHEDNDVQFHWCMVC